MAGNGTLYLFGGAYAEIGAAMKDFSEMQILHRDNSLGGYDAAIATRQSDGSVIVSNVDHTGWFLSITAGGVIGALIGVIVSPAPVVMAAVGAAGGAALGTPEDAAESRRLQGAWRSAQAGRIRDTARR